MKVSVCCPVEGQLKPGGTVVEGTAGNTGIGLAHMCLAMGYRCVIYMPDNQSQVGGLSRCIMNAKSVINRKVL